MRWLISLAFVGLATLVVCQTSEPELAIRRTFVRSRPQMKLAVQPSIARGPVEVIPVDAAQAYLPYGGQQFYPRFGGSSDYLGWNNPAINPYWGGYPSRNWASLGGPYWRPRLIKPAAPIEAETAVEALPVAVPVPVPVAEVKPEAEVPVIAGLDAELDNGVNVDVDPSVV